MDSALSDDSNIVDIMSLNLFDVDHAPQRGYPASSVNSVPTRDSSGTTYTHTIESELRGVAVPRTVRRQENPRFNRRIIANFCLVTLGILYFFGRRDYDTRTKLIEQGVITPARVFAKSNGTRDAPNERTYHLCYSFNYDTNSMTFANEVDAATFGTASVGDTIVVTYLPHTNASIWQQGLATPRERDERMLIWWGAGVAVAVLFAGGLLWHPLRSRRQAWFLRQGVTTVGCIYSDEVAEGISQIEGARYYLHYHYKVGGKSYSDYVQVTPSQYTNRLDKNPYFTLLYDATRPARSMPYFCITAVQLAERP